MGRQKGDGRGRLGGRSKGTPNKMTVDLREAIREFVDGNFNEFVKTWKDIKIPKYKCDIYIALCKFVLPTLSAVNMNAQVEQKTFSEELEELSREEAEQQ